MARLLRPLRLHVVLRPEPRQQLRDDQVAAFRTVAWRANAPVRRHVIRRRPIVRQWNAAALARLGTQLLELAIEDRVKLGCRDRGARHVRIESPVAQWFKIRAMRIIRAVAACIVALLCPLAAAQPTLFLEELTSPEVAAAVKAGKTTILVPIGGTEQNGPNIVLGKHNVRARLLAADIASRLGNALVAPVIAYVPEGSIDPPTGHMRQAGTISIPADAFEKTLEGAARSFIHHGFRTVVFLGDHGGYQASLHRVAARLNRRGARPAVLVPKDYYRELEHAGPADTDLTLAIDPKLVRDQGNASVERGRNARREIVEETAAAIAKATGR